MNTAPLSQAERAELCLLLKKLAQTPLLLLKKPIEQPKYVEYFKFIGTITVNDESDLQKKRIFVKWLSEVVMMEGLNFHEAPTSFYLLWEIYPNPFSSFEDKENVFQCLNVVYCVAKLVEWNYERIGQGIIFYKNMPEYVYRFVAERVALKMLELSFLGYYGLLDFIDIWEIIDLEDLRFNIKVLSIFNQGVALLGNTTVDYEAMVTLIGNLVKADTDTLDASKNLPLIVQFIQEVNLDNVGLSGDIHIDFYFQVWLLIGIQNKGFVWQGAVPESPTKVDLSLFTSFEEYMAIANAHNGRLIDSQRSPIFALYVALIKEISIRTIFPYMTKKAAALFYQDVQEHINTTGFDSLFKIYIYNSSIYELRVDYIFYMAILKTAFQDVNFTPSMLQKKYINHVLQEAFTPFGISVLAFIHKFEADFKPLAVADVDLIFSYIQHAKDENPNFEMKKRTFASIYRYAKEWHHRVCNQYQAPRKTWAGAKYPTLEEKGKLGNRFFIQQITNNHDLFEEGIAMNHCVGNYVEDCVKGLASIWSLRKKTKGGKIVPLVTIEVNKNRLIEQVKASHNRMPNEQYMALIKKWGLKAGLKIRNL